jgi:hypothetical protein
MGPPTAGGKWLRGHEGLWLTAGAALLTVVLWGRVLIGQRVLVAGDILYGVLPWSASAGAHVPANALVSDTVVTTLAWQTVVRNALWHGHLPLWNTHALEGSPLFANDQTAAFFPLTILALPFDPAHAVSLVMIAKLWIAGLGTALFLRQLGAGGKAAFLGGLAFATSSYIVVWLGYPNSTPAALLPLGFASVEWFLRKGRPLALAVLALDVGLMFLGGHAPSEAQLIGALAVYAAIRLAAPRAHRLREIGGLLGAMVTGALVGGIQVLPFLEALTLGITFNLRQGLHAGEGHLSLTTLATWLIPNSQGNPAIDGLTGRLPNFSESAGFAGVGALVLGSLGAMWLWRRQRSAAVALVTLLLVCLGIVYGPLTPIAGRLPILAVSNNARLIAVLCFGVAVLGGLGLEVVASAPVRRSRIGSGLALGGGVVLIALAGAWFILYRIRGRVDSLLPMVHGNFGFWLAVGGLSVLAAVLFIAAGLWGGIPRAASTGLVALAVVEAMLFAWPFNPVTRLSDVPPRSQAMDWLQSHAGDGEVAAAYPAMIPESATLYGLRDVGGYDLVVTPRVVDFWTAADPGFEFKDNHTNLSRPGAAWLAAAGVTEMLVPGNQALPGTTQTFQGEGVAIGAVPAARPFAYAASRTVLVSSPATAAQALTPDPLGVVAVEGGCCAGVQGGATVTVLERGDDVVRLKVNADAATTVVVGQAFYPGWNAQLDGHQTTIRPANILFQSVQVPAGTHDLTIRYEPSRFAFGALLSVLGIAGLLGLIALDRLSGRRSRGAAEE